MACYTGESCGFVVEAPDAQALYGTFPLLTGTPESIRDLLPAGSELVALDPGETVVP